MRYYYKHITNGGLLNLKTPTDQEGFIQITEEEYKQLNPKIEGQIDPKLMEKQLLIEQLKAELASTDYQAIKYAEGWISEEEYAPIKAYRQELRNQINELSALLN